MNRTAQYRDAGSGSFCAMAPLQVPRIMTAQKVAKCTSLSAASRRPATVARLADIAESTPSLGSLAR